MKVKRYLVDSINEAVGIIRKEMGPDAIIISSKPVKIGGFLGFFAQRKIEVLAAIDEEVRKPSAEEQRGKASSFQEVMEEKMNSSKPENQAAITYQRPRPKAGAVPAQGTDDHVTKELKEMRQMMVSFMLGQKETPPSFEPFRQLRDHLLQQDVHEAVVVEILDQILQRKASDYTWTNEEVWQEAEAVVQTIFSKRIKPSTKATTFPRLIQVVGPTGVGKTTTIAKLAADQVLKKKRVAFVTSDTYRIAAVEQLKTYATILNVPFEVVFSAADLQKSLQKCSDFDLIFMDTAGRNFLQSEYIQEVRNWMEVAKGSTETYLVLSLTMKNTDMEKIIQQFSGLGIDRLILTKSDETMSYGSILNLAVHHPFYFSYLTNGQSVPDDIIEVDADKLATLLLGVNANE